MSRATRLRLGHAEKPSERLAPKRSAMRPGARQRPLPNAEICGGEDSWRSSTVFAMPSPCNPTGTRSANRLRHFHGGAKGHVSSWQILLQKSEIEVRRIFREDTRQEAIADSYSLARLAEVACEFNERRRGPSYLYTKTAPIALRIFEPQCKTTFATVSALLGHPDSGSACPELEQKRSFAVYLEDLSG
jgi:hypothetical protein